MTRNFLGSWFNTAVLSSTWGRKSHYMRSKPISMIVIRYNRCICYAVENSRHDDRSTSISSLLTKSNGPGLTASSMKCCPPRSGSLHWGTKPALKVNMLLFLAAWKNAANQRTTLQQNFAFEWIILSLEDYLVSLYKELKP